MGSLLFLLGLGAQGSVCALQESISQSCVGSGSPTVGLMATSSKRAYAIPICCIQSLCPCNGPPPTHTSTGDAQTQFCLSLCGVPGSWCSQDLFEPSEHLWQEWGLILNMILPLLPSCWGFSFALGHGISPQSCSSAMQPPLQCCTAAAPVQEHSLFSTPSPQFIVFRLFDDGHSDRCELKSHCGFDLHFSNN